MTIILLLTFALPRAQTQSLALGKWQTHFSPLSGKNIVEANGKIYYTTYNGLFSIDTETKEIRSWSKSDGFSDIGISSLAFKKENGLLLVAYRSGLIDFVFLNDESSPERIEAWKILSETPGITTSKAVNKIVFREMLAYLCTDFGIVLLDTKLRQVEETYRYIGPAGAQVSVKDLAFSSDSIFAVTSSGLLTASLLPEVNRQYFANWTKIDAPGSPVSIAFFDSRFYGGFSRKGLFERNSSNWKEVFNSESDFFQTNHSENRLVITETKGIRIVEPGNRVNAVSDPAFQALSSAFQTEPGIFWIADKKKGIITNQDTDFHVVDFEESDTTIFPRPDSVVTDQAGLTWSKLPDYLGGGISVKNADGKQRTLSSITGGGSLPSNSINSLAVDSDGYVWFASDRGAGYFVSEGVLDGGRIDAILPVYGKRKLFNTEKCTAIAVEPGNRKWLATRTGLHLFSADGTELLEKFDTDNSPLPSNLISSLKMDAESGLLFIDTPNGMVSYQTSSSAPAENLSGITIFPNPVRPNYSGAVGIKGLKGESSVKITELSGRLVYETRSQGGTATWNLLDYTSKRAKGGIYMVFIVSGDRTEKLAGKLAVID
ncbi:PorZ beta-propeller-like domain-containing protein [Dyadobacter aurulentus]|uniref:PorZ beta-propeller-like domain-containing protein n=1 Tax=Dyadobacter sp. UC 10 TaxID=2605428 RepID=UPI001CECFC5D|nr:two-component regulator propeller domain-containing protein [Dyadobacter sp. UC 10]